MWESLIREKIEDKDFSIQKYLDAQEIIETDENTQTSFADFVRLETTNPLKNTLLEIIALAGSIRATGLTNPITVVRHNKTHYQLETGERRWLAYHLLNTYVGDDLFANIPAQVVDSVDLWRQAAENNARANLNAIGKARQFAVLLMQLLQEHKGIQFAEYRDFERDQDYYAQVGDADGEDAHRIPRGTSEKLIVGTGLKNGTQLRQYRQLLRLPNDVWQLADDLAWTEYSIRSMVSRSKNDTHLIELANERAHAEGYTVTTDTVSKNKKRKKQQKPSVPETNSRRYFSYVYGLLKSTGDGKIESNREALKHIDELQQFLEQERSRITQLLDK